MSYYTMGIHKKNIKIKTNVLMTVNKDRPTSGAMRQERLDSFWSVCSDMSHNLQFLN